MWLWMLWTKCIEVTFESALWRKVKNLKVWLCICLEKCFENTPENAHWYEYIGIFVHIHSYQNQWECHIGCICFIFSTVGFQMSPQMALEDALTLVNLFTFLHFQMNHQLTARFDWICFLFHHSLLCFQMQPVWRCILFCRVFENTFDKTQWRKDIEVQTMCLYILLEKCFEVTFEHTQWKKVEQMETLRLCLFTGRQFESTFENS